MVYGTTSTLPVGRGLKQSLKKYSPGLTERVRRRFARRQPEVEQPFEELRRAVRVQLVAGLVNVTVVPRGTRRCVGAMPLTAVDSVAPTVLVAAL